MNKRAWSSFELKSVNEEARRISGIASTPNTDRMGDIVEPLGAKFDLPLPFLWQHDSTQPIGHVVAAKPNKNGIPVDIQLARIDEPGTLKDRLDEAWQSIRSGLVRGMSIGFTPKEYSFLDDGGIHFMEWNWLELSAVTIPANAEASITSIKRADGMAKRTNPVTKSLVQRIYQRGVRLTKAEIAIVGELLRDHVALMERVEALETEVANREYKGVFVAADDYVKHNMVTHNGNLWIALRDYPGYPGQEGNGWQLAVRKGRDGRDA